MHLQYLKVTCSHSRWRDSAPERIYSLPWDYRIEDRIELPAQFASRYSFQAASPEMLLLLVALLVLQAISDGS